MDEPIAFSPEFTAFCLAAAEADGHWLYDGDLLAQQVAVCRWLRSVPHATFERILIIFEVCYAHRDAIIPQARHATDRDPARL